tara:strand:- start:181 stop:1044 length:864 start_codon:yes stop_codon:yes gene_type:complete
MGKIINNNRLPSFLIIGAEKAGTTSVSTILNSQKSIFIPKVKEVHYFSIYWDNNLEWYQDYFPENKKYILGEASPSYAVYPKVKNVPERIYKTIPNVRLIYVIRNPFDRLISHYRHALYNNWLPNNCDIDESIKRLPQLIDTGKYFFQLQQYLEFFDKKQIKVVCIEKLNNNPNNFMNIFNFIGLENPKPVKIKRKNVTNEKYFVPNYLDFLRKNKYIRSIAGGYHGGGLFINRFYNGMKLFSRKKVPSPKISLDQQKKLKDFLIPDIMNLSDYTNTDYIKFWNLND